MSHDNTDRTGASSVEVPTGLLNGKSLRSITVPPAVRAHLVRPWIGRMVICAITGRADGRNFDVNEYKNVSPRDIAKGLDDILSVAVEKVAEELLREDDGK